MTRKEIIIDCFNDDLYMEDIVNQSKRDGNKYRIGYCTAWYVSDDSNALQWIISYDTVVACYDTIECILYSFGRYSTTTYQHIRKFRNDYTRDMFFTKEENLGIVNNWRCYDNIYRDNSYYKRQHIH